MAHDNPSSSNSRAGMALAAGLAALATAGLALAAPPKAGEARAAAAGKPQVPAARASLVEKAQGILATHCLACHGEKSQMGGLRLDTRSALLKGGKRGTAFAPRSLEKSLLLRAVRHQGEVKMPPGGKLSDAEIETLTRWLETGAAYETRIPPPGQAAAPKAQSLPPSGGPKSKAPNPLWAFRPLQRPKTPQVRNRWWLKNPIDAFVLAGLEKRGMKPSPYADRRTLIRRVSLDLTGLPPTPEEVEAFVQDRSPDAYEKVVDRLLASRHYGERLAIKWLDLARYADSDGYHDDTDRSMWPYRDYVINAFNGNKPFDQFTIEQLAGDTLPNATDEQKIASAFNRCGPTSSEGGAIPEEYLAKYAVDRVNTTTSVWLGLTFGCAECHDHKYDPVTTREYYQFFAFFNQVPEQALHRGADAPPTLFHPTPEQKKRLEELAKLIPPAEEEAKPRMGVADAEAEKARVAEAKKKLEALTKERAEVEKHSKVRIMADVPERRPTHILVRGDYTKKGEEVQPAVPAVLGKLPEGVASPRLALAKWLVDPSNPLTPRVTVNRFWEMIFGHGLARSSDDFGSRGERPTHPELLDFLASVFSGTGTVTEAQGNVKTQGGRGQRAGAPGEQDRYGLAERRGAWVKGAGESGNLLTLAASDPRGSGYALRNTHYAASGTGEASRPQPQPWDVKALLKLIVMSATYQQASRVTPELVAMDPDNRLLARGPRFRMPAEMIRDNALAISGLFDRERPVGGPSVKPYQPGDLWRELSAGDQEAKSYVQDHGPDLYRRGLYTFWKRSVLYPAFAVFDAPKREVCTVQRPITNTPLQAFATLNDTAYVEAARVFAQLILKQGGPTVDTRLDFAYRRALARPATLAERQVLTRILNRSRLHYRGDVKAATQLVSVGEYARPPELDVSELAAWTCVCNALLNLDETITKE